MLKDYINELCDILDIESPTISYKTDTFNSNTMQAQVDVLNNIIYIRPFNKINPDILIFVAHELRHLWQHKTNRDYFFKDYKTVDKCKNIDEYNLQIAELDANAFSAVVMVDMFGLEPLFNGLSEDTVNKIYDYIDVIEI